ncbi:MAG: XdhC family protein, partial [Rhizobiaceae bacterium]|nr:XdhC family protein [Rhizobiaceae bacterium]
PCGGGITVAIHVLGESAALRTVLADIARRRSASLCYDPGARLLTAMGGMTQTGWSRDGFVTRYRPHGRIFLAGRSIEIEVAAKVAAAAGYDVLLYGGSSSLPAAETIDEDTAVALLYHDIDLEVPVLEAALHSNPFYIGALGSSRTHGRRVQRLRELGYSEAEIARIKSPIGIFNRARDSQSLALSILADIAERRLSAVG